MHKILTDQLAWRRTGEEGVVLDLGRSRYLALNDTASVLWELLIEGAEQSRLVVALQEEFEVDSSTAEASVEAFLADLSSRGYLTSAP